MEFQRGLKIDILGSFILGQRDEEELLNKIEKIVFNKGRRNYLSVVF